MNRKTDDNPTDPDLVVKRLQAEAMAQLKKDMAAAAARARRDPTRRERELFIFELGKLRLDRKLSQAELAAKVGTRQANISRLERGQGNPRLKTLLKIAQALDARLVIE